MLFHWKNNGDQLFVRRGKNPNPNDVTSEGKPWTTFACELREPFPMPEPEQFCRFLASSLAFTTRLRKLSVLFDGHLLCSLEKKLGPAKPLSAPSTFYRTSPQRLVSIDKFDQTGVQLDAKVSVVVSLMGEEAKAAKKSASASGTGGNFATRFLQNALFSGSSSNTPAASPTPDLRNMTTKAQLELQSASLFLRIVNVNVKVTLPVSTANEIERATKKRPPSATTCQLIYTVCRFSES